MSGLRRLSAQTLSTAGALGGQLVTFNAVTGKYEAAPSPATPTNLQPLRAWRAALGGRLVTPAVCMAIADSVTEGQGASVRTRRWLDQFTAQLRSRLGNGGVLGSDGANYQPADYVLQVSPSSFANPWTYSGTTSQVYGVALRARSLDAAGNTMTITRHCTSFEIHHLVGFGNTPYTVTVDGGAPVTVTPSGTNNTVGKYTSGALTSANHTIVLTGTAATTYIMGAYFYDGDETSGIHVIDASRWGATTSSWTNSGNSSFGNNSSFVSADYQAMPYWPSLVTFFLGFNDYSNQVNPVTVTQTNLQNHIAAIKALHAAASKPNPSFLLVTPYRRTDVNDTTATFKWAQYLAAYSAIAAADPSNVAAFSFTDRLDPGTQAYSLLADAVHPNDKGYGYLADAFFSTVAPA